MTKARDISDLLDANGDVKSTALDNVPPSNDASALTTGTIDNARISLDANEIPNLDTSKITSGTFADARMPSTVLNSNVDLTNLSASNLTSGTLPDARFPATLPAVSGANLTNLPGGGKVLQVVVGTDSTIRSTSSTSYTTAGNTLSATITPSSTSNKILCIITCGTNQYNRAFDYTIARNGTRLTGDGENGLYSREESRGEHISIMYYDSPNSTSALTYQLYIRENTNIGDGTGYINTNDTFLNVEGRCIVMEIDGT